MVQRREWRGLQHFWIECLLLLTDSRKREQKYTVEMREKDCTLGHTQSRMPGDFNNKQILIEVYAGLCRLLGDGETPRTRQHGVSSPRWRQMSNNRGSAQGSSRKVPAREPGVLPAGLREQAAATDAQL